MATPQTDQKTLRSEEGYWNGQQVARCFTSPDGFTVLVGKTSQDNDILSLKLARPRDFWLHVAGESGSHVVVRNLEGLQRMPRSTSQYAADLAAYYSKARKGGRVAVHLAFCGDVSKPRRFAPGKVSLKRFTTIHGKPSRIEKEFDGNE